MNILGVNGKPVVVGGKVILPPDVAWNTCTVTVDCDWIDANYYSYTDATGVGVINNNPHTSFVVLKNSFVILGNRYGLDSFTGAEFIRDLGYSPVYRIIEDTTFSFKY